MLTMPPLGAGSSPIGSTGLPVSIAGECWSSDCVHTPSSPTYPVLDSGCRFIASSCESFPTANL